jgi:hypothetical protein
MRRLSKMTGTIGAGVVALALAGSAIGGVEAAATTATAPTLPPVVVLTNTSSGTTVVATIGESVVVQLTGGHVRWTEASVVPPSTGAAVGVLTFVSGSTSLDGSSTTTFKVTHTGTARLQATGTSICPAGTACPPYVVLWQAGVSVPVVDPPVAPA